MEIKIGADGGKSCHVTITGQLSANLSMPAPILLFADLVPPPKGLRLNGVQFAIQEKMGFNLWWILPPDGEIPAYKLILPLESRGNFDFEKIKPIISPDAALGIALTSFKITEKNMSFMLMLNLSKL
jgi:hypothetical protein